MLQFSTYDEMRRWGRNDRAIEFSKQAAESSKKTVFLSHSSKDEELVAGAMLILEIHGGRVYVDDGDPFLDENNCITIAGQFRERIRTMRKIRSLGNAKFEKQCLDAMGTWTR